MQTSIAKNKFFAVVDGLHISITTPNDVLGDMERCIAERGAGRYISITNTESMYHAKRVPQHADFINGAEYSLCDSIGVVMVGWGWGHYLRRLTGPALQLLASDYGQSKGWRHYFYGGKPGVAEEMAKRLKTQFPNMIVCGMASPPFLKTAEEHAPFIADIVSAQPDIVWVGLGLLKQEEWIRTYRRAVNAPWMIGVGAAFDYHSGAVPWAPPLLRHTGLEWVFRLAIQPRIRAKRYWWSLTYVAQGFARGVFALRFLRPRFQISNAAK